MPSSDFQLQARWRIAGQPREIYDVLADTGALTRWWPASHVAIRVLERGGADGLNELTEVVSRLGPLPTMRWRFRVIEARRPSRYGVELSGDLVGHGSWTLAEDEPYVDLVSEWRLSAGRPLPRAISRLLPPLVHASHRWAMARGEMSLRLELRRRRAVTEHERAMVPLPPGPPLARGRRTTVVPGLAEPGADA